MNKKILFLDCDGVLNHFRDPNSPKDENGVLALDPKHVVHLNTIIEKTDADIVISSTWREFFRLNRLKQLFTQAGFLFSEKIIGETPVHKRRFSELVHRCDEIHDWLESNHHTMSTFAIVDDNADAAIPGHFAQTDGDVGLTAELAEKLITILNQ